MRWSAHACAAGSGERLVDAAVSMLRELHSELPAPKK